MTIETDKQTLERIKMLTSAETKEKAWPGFPTYWDPAKNEGHNAAQLAPTGAKDAYCIFFYYFRIDTGGKLRVTHYFFEHHAPITDLEARIGHIARYARNKIWDPANDEEPVMLRYANFKGIEFQRISYTVIFVDDVHWDFLLDGSYNPVVPFHKKKNDQDCDPNYSFYNARVHKITMPKNGGADIRHALSMLNLLRREDGEELGTDLPPIPPEEQLFAFDLVLRVTFANADEYDGSGDAVSDDPSRLTVIFDPGGTNLGPPITRL